MSALNGGFASTPETLDEFIELFVDGITHEEWVHLANMPRIPHWTTLVAVVVELRKELAWPLADREHPLNPARRSAA